MEFKVFLFLFFLFYSIELNGGNVASSEQDESVAICGDEEERCDFINFKQFSSSFRSAETVKIIQPQVWISMDMYTTPTLCEVFGNVRSLELSFDFINDPKFIDCKFHSLEELIIGGKLLDTSFEIQLENLFQQNTHIQRMTIKSPANYRTYQLIQKYLKNLEEVRIFDSMDDDNHETIFIPSVQKLEMRFSSEAGCHPPMKVLFGGTQLRELLLSCDETEGNYKYFSTLYRYPSIKTLYAGRWIHDSDLLKLIGKFKFLERAQFTFHPSVKNESIVKFIENCEHLKELTIYGTIESIQERKAELEASIGDRFTITDSPLGSELPNSYSLRIERNRSNRSSKTDSNSTNGSTSALKFITSGLINFLIAIHICCACFF